MCEEYISRTTDARVTQFVLVLKWGEGGQAAMRWEDKRQYIQMSEQKIQTSQKAARKVFVFMASLLIIAGALDSNGKTQTS